MDFEINRIKKRGRYTLFPDLERKYKAKGKIGNYVEVYRQRKLYGNKRKI